VTSFSFRRFTRVQGSRHLDAGREGGWVVAKKKDKKKKGKKKK